MFSFNVYSYNTDIAKVFGVCSAVFVTFLAAEKTKLNVNGSDELALSRDEIFAITALDFEKQQEIEKSLIECGVLAVKSFRGNKNKNHYLVDFDRLQIIMNSASNVIELFEPLKFEKKPKAAEQKAVETKQQRHVASLKSKFSSYEPVLRQYLCDWVDAVYDKPKGFITAAGLKISLNELDCNSNSVDESIEILKIAIKGGLRDLTWAINKYNESKKLVDLNNFSSYNEIKSDGSNTINEEF